MYTLVLILLLLVSALVFRSGLKGKSKGRIFTGLFLALVTLLFFWFMGFWGEKLWFDSLGYSHRFWKLWLIKIILFSTGFLSGGLFVFLLITSVSKKNKIKWFSPLLGGGINAIFWLSQWEVVLKFIYKDISGVEEPILSQSTGFYLFTLPFYNSLFLALLLLSAVALVSVIIYYTRSYQGTHYFVPFDHPEGLKRFDSLFISTSVILFLFAFGIFLRRFNLLYSNYGVVAGPGWTDDHIRLPMLNISLILFLLAGILLIIPVWRRKIRKLFSRKNAISETMAVIITGGILAGFWLILVVFVPLLFQKLKVVPNEITSESPYIKNSIQFTRLGFHLDKVEDKMYPVSDDFSPEVVENNRNLFENIRLWDYRALDAVFKQFQEIRLYYEFEDVDIDRYHFNNEYRQVMISAREMEQSNLPQQSQTFVNERFKYTHGFGIVLNNVNEFTPSGLPNLLVRNIPPVSSYPELTVKRPEIYYGELTREPVVVNSEEEEFDYPSGENNVYTRYQGSGGVPMTNLFWRKLLFGWKFDGTRFLFSGYPTSESRIMFHREIKERINTLAPFLQYDSDPYIVLADGDLFWIIDAYTTSDNYPYSEPFTMQEYLSKFISPDVSSKRYQNVFDRIEGNLGGINYIRNAVKVVINAYNGNVDFYVFDEEDPIINVYRSIFPGMFKKEEEMPENLRKHVRYPSDFLLIQGLVYAKYHMTDPAVFYNQEDLWVRATEKYYSDVIPVEPYYILWEPNESDSLEFILMMPFTPKNKQVLIGWLAGMCDNENYGRLLAYKFPKEKRVLGTQQFETKIDQDSFLSGQLTLWDQRGSNVIRGNVLVIPVSNTIFYVEPIYLQSETAAYPELRLVAVMHNDNLSYAGNFAEALEGIFTEEKSGRITQSDTLQQSTGVNTGSLIQQAEKAFQDYIDYTSRKQFSEAGKALNDLQKALEELSGKGKE